MKIDNNTPQLPASQIGELAPKSPNAKPTGGSAAENRSPASNETSVHLGSSSVHLNNLEKSMASTPVVDREKVDAIKKAISEGKFQINPAAIADGLLNSVQELISTKSGNKA